MNTSRPCYCTVGGPRDTPGHAPSPTCPICGGTGVDRAMSEPAREPEIRDFTRADHKAFYLQATLAGIIHRCDRVLAHPQGHHCDYRKAVESIRDQAKNGLKHAVGYADCMIRNKERRQ